MELVKNLVAHLYSYFVQGVVAAGMVLLLFLSCFLMIAGLSTNGSRVVVMAARWKVVAAGKGWCGDGLCGGELVGRGVSWVWARGPFHKGMAQ